MRRTGLLALTVLAGGFAAVAEVRKPSHSEADAGEPATVPVTASARSVSASASECDLLRGSKVPFQLTIETESGGRKAVGVKEVLRDASGVTELAQGGFDIGVRQSRKIDGFEVGAASPLGTVKRRFEGVDPAKADFGESYLKYKEITITMIFRTAIRTATSERTFPGMETASVGACSFEILRFHTVTDFGGGHIQSDVTEYSPELSTTLVMTGEAKFADGRATRAGYRATDIHVKFAPLAAPVAAQWEAAELRNAEKPASGFIFDGDSVWLPTGPELSIRLDEKISERELRKRFAGYEIAYLDVDDMLVWAAVADRNGGFLITFRRDGQTVESISSLGSTPRDAAGNGIGGSLREALGGSSGNCHSYGFPNCDAPGRTWLSYEVDPDETRCPITFEAGKSTTIPECARIGGFRVGRGWVPRVEAKEFGFVFDGGGVSRANKPDLNVRIGERLTKESLVGRFSDYRVHYESWIDCDCERAHVGGADDDFVIQFQKDGETVESVSTSNRRARDAKGNWVGDSLRKAIGASAVCRSDGRPYCASPASDGPWYIPDIDSGRCRVEIKEGGLTQIPECAGIAGFRSGRREPGGDEGGQR